MTTPDDRQERAARIASSVKETAAETGDSRRGFLGRSALAGGALLALGSGTGVVFAQDDDGGDGNGGTDGQGTDEETAATFDDVDGTDVDVLNYALSLEHLEDAFYREALETFTEDDFTSAEALQSFDEETRQAVYSYIQAVGEHESAHVDVLSQAIELLGGDPVQAGSYEFGVESVNDFLALGQVLENTGVAAYAGAAPYIESPDLLSAALSIHSVEARHAAFLNHLNGESPFPNAFDPALSQAEVLDAVSQFAADGNGETETETPTETETETPTETETETPTETDMGTDTATDVPGVNGAGNGNGTATPTADDENG